MFAKFFRLIVVAVVSLFVVASLAACDPEGGSSDSSPFVLVDCSSGQCVAVSTPAPTPVPTVAPQPTPDWQAIDVHKAADGMACMFNDPIAAMLGDCSKSLSLESQEERHKTSTPVAGLEADRSTTEYAHVPGTHSASSRKSHCPINKRAQSFMQELG